MRRLRDQVKKTLEAHAAEGESNSNAKEGLKQATGLLKQTESMLMQEKKAREIADTKW